MPDHTITCSICGKVENLSFYNYKRPITQKMIDECICFECAYWKRYLENPPLGTAIISGGLYRIIFLPENARLRVSSKAVSVMDMRNPHVYQSDSYSFCGNVPVQFRDRLPDQYRFISCDSFKKMRNYMAPHCLAKGCYDRYHCYWYNKDVVEKEGAWNKVPEGYVIGSEKCPSFIDKYNMYEDDLH